jgi:hypothetical protein
MRAPRGCSRHRDRVAASTGADSVHLVMHPIVQLVVKLIMQPMMHRAS